MTDTRETAAAPTAELWASVDRIVKPSRRRLVRDDRTIERVMLPSLFSQLVEAIQTGSGTQAHGVQSSKPPLDVMALALLIEIAGAVRSGCKNWSLKRTFDTPKDLRQIASAVIAYGDPDLIEFTTWVVWQWGSRIKATISCDPDRSWRLHGAACRVCSCTTVPFFDADGVESRQPALIVHSEDGVINSIECGFCGSRLSSDAMTGIVKNAQRRAIKRLRPFAC